MVILNLVKKDIEKIKDTRPQNIKLVDVLIESRNSYNELVDALTAINTALTDISNKLDKHPVEDLKDLILFNAETISDVQTKLMPALETKINAGFNKVKAELTVKLGETEEKVEFQEGHSRRRNLIFNGKKEEKGEKIEEVVQDILRNDLQMESAVVDNYLFRDFHRLPKAKNKDGTVREGPRPIIVAFLRQKDRNETMRNAFKLKGSDCSIKSDLPKKLNELRTKMLTERRRLKTIDPHTKYRVAERSYKPVLQKEDGLMEGTTKTKWTDVKIPGGNIG